MSKHDRPAGPLDSAAVTLRHAAALGRLAGDDSLTLLHIGVDDTLVVSGRPGQPPLRMRLPIGTRLTGVASLCHDPPTPLELENAIAVVEDELAPLARRLPGLSQLLGDGVALQRLPGLAGLPVGDVVLTIDQIEHLFRDLAAVADGRPAASAGVPAGPDYAATVLILREFMHHLGFTSIGLPGCAPQIDGG